MVFWVMEGVNLNKYKIRLILECMVYGVLYSWDMFYKDLFYCYKIVMYFLNLIEWIISDVFCIIYLELWGF